MEALVFVHYYDKPGHPGRISRRWHTESAGFALKSPTVEEVQHGCGGLCIIGREGYCDCAGSEERGAFEQARRKHCGEDWRVFAEFGGAGDQIVVVAEEEDDIAPRVDDDCSFSCWWGGGSC